MSVQFQKEQGHQVIKCGILTVSDTRTKETDKSGRLTETLLLEAGHDVISHEIVKDDPLGIQQTIEGLLSVPSVQAVLINGGTGIAKRDVTYEVVERLLDKELPGFGELFRYLSFTEDIGTGALLSRAIAGSYETKAIFSMPGSTGAVRLAMTRLILPELRHIIYELNK
ncbi:MAG TPA: MogA/MoaB family molybdenum cofactor biosynthesis protein [Candidatus Angelobacter sp.]|nr:MogA/MoaB family molybdenum cofactor biosynthesis protein [Candidatus Angelobacter sp.]